MLMDEIKNKTYFKIIEQGIIQVRALAMKYKATEVFAELNHIHNLPNLIYEYSPEKEKYYLEIERQEYIKQTANGLPENFESLWKKL